jgi:hypothetical protein
MEQILALENHIVITEAENNALESNLLQFILLKICSYFMLLSFTFLHQKFPYLEKLIIVEFV